LLIISLTTIPSRFHLLQPTLKSIVNQTAKIDRIILYIPKSYRRFPDYDGALPDVIDGVEIRHVDDDFGPATKVLCAAKEFADQDCDILFCDDDRIYPKNWAQAFVAERVKQPNACIAALGREANTLFESDQIREHMPRVIKRPWESDYWFLIRYAWWLLRRRFPAAPDRPRRRVFKVAGYIDMFMGFGGVMVKPSFFDALDYDIPDACWTVDDFWISGMLMRKGIPIWVPANIIEPVNSDAYMVDALFAAEIEGTRRDNAGQICFDYLQETYGVWP